MHQRHLESCSHESNIKLEFSLSQGEKGAREADKKQGAQRTHASPAMYQHFDVK